MTIRTFFAGLTAVALTAALASPAVTSAEAPDHALAVNGLLGVRFETPAGQIERRVERTLRAEPTITSWSEYLCGLTSQASWSDGITVYIGHGKFVGYQIGPTKNARLLALTTLRGLHVNQTTQTARLLYGRQLTTSWAQDGSYTIKTSQGKLVGYIHNASPHTTMTPNGGVETIDAGNDGCPAMSP